LNVLSFFHPEFLWALAALAIPLAIHFLARRPPKRIDFSTLRFFSAGAMRKSRMRRIKRLLLLLVRLGIVLIIVLIFLRPFDRRDPFAALRNPDAAVYEYVDPTISMDYRVHPGKALWQDAFDVLDSLDKILPQTAQRKIYDDGRDEFVPRNAFSSPTPAFLRFGESKADKMLRTFDAASRREKGMPILIAISDFQRSESRAFDTAFSHRLTAPVACLSVAPADAWDFRVSGVSASGENHSSVSVRVAAVGKPLRDASLSASIGGLRVGHAVLKIDKGNQADVSIPVTSGAAAPVGTVRLDADDPFPLDNEGFFIRAATQATRVLIVGDPYETFSLGVAFESLGRSVWNVCRKKVNEVSYGDVDSAALVVLCGVRQLSQPLELLVHGRSFGPKAILFSPIVDSANVFVNIAVLSPGERHPLRYLADGTSHSLVLPDTLSVVFQGFPHRMDPDARIYRYLGGIPGSAIIRLDNRQPFATALLDTSGNSWIVFATSLGLAADANNLVETGLYVALLDRLSRHALSLINRDARAWTAGEAVRNPYMGSKGGAQVYDAGNRLVGTWSRQPSVVFDKPGCYRIQPNSERAYWVCVTIDSLETDFSYRFPVPGRMNEDMVRCMTVGQFIPFVKSGHHGSISAWLWIALGLLIVAEVFLWERYRQESDVPNPT